MRTTHRRKDRPLEWFLAGFAVVWGAVAAAGPGLTAMAPSGASDVSTQWALACAGLGLVQVAALLVNGTAVWTPPVRLLATAANAGFFAHGAALAWPPAGQAAEAAVYGWAAVGFAWCAWVAGLDAARMRLGSYGH